MIRDHYPTLDVPFHARWRHFVVDGVDLLGPVADARDLARCGDARAATEFDLAIVSVLLDAGAGPAWRYQRCRHRPHPDPLRRAGHRLACGMFEAGAFSAEPDDPLARRRRGPDLARPPPTWPTASRSRTRQSAGRARGPRRPAAPTRRRPVWPQPDLFALERRAATRRPVRRLLAAADEHGRLPAPAILEVLLEALGPIWRDRLTLGGVDLGDCWRHPAIKRDDATDGLVPIHKLSQWLSYSLIEPLQTAGVEVTDLDGLTGLAEYRNGGLFMDLGVLTLKDPRRCGQAVARVRPAGGRLARADRRAARQDRAAGARPARRHRRADAAGQRAGGRHLGRRAPRWRPNDARGAARP